MDTTEWLALGGCAAAFVWVNWYFPWADRRGRAADANAGPAGVRHAGGRRLLRGHLVVEGGRS